MPSPPLGLKRYFRPPWGRSIQLGHLLWPPPLNDPIYTHTSPSLLWQSLLSWHLLCSLLSCPFLLLRGASGHGFWSPTNSSIRPSLSPVFRPNERPPSSNFQKARWDYFASHCPSAEEYSSLSLSSAAALFTSLALNVAKSSIPFGRIKRHPKAWWSADVEDAVSERRNAFAAAHKSDEDRQADTSASRRASSVIAKTKAEAWQTTCLSLSPKSNPKSVHSLLRSIAGSPSSSSSSPNFPNCSSPREPASVYAAYLRSHFSVSQPKTVHSRARGHLSELRRATCPEESHSSFCSPFSPAEFLEAASNLSSFTATGPDKVAYSMLKHLPRSDMDFLLHIFNFSLTLHSFPSIWKTSSIIPIHKIRKPLDSPASFRPISLTSCVSKLFERIILSHLLFFLKSNSILSPRQADFRLRRSALVQILFLSQSIRMGLTNPGRDLGRSCLLSTSLKLLTLSGIPSFSTNLFRLASLFALLVGLNLSFLTSALAWFFKITKVAPFESVEVFRKDPFLAVYFSLSSSMIFPLLCLLPSAALFTLTIWPFGPPPPRSPLQWRSFVLIGAMFHKELCFDWSASLSTGVFLLIRANVRPPSSQWIPTKLTSSSTSSYSDPASVSIPLQLFLASFLTALFPFLNMYLRWRPSSSHVSRPYAVSLLPHGVFSKEFLSVLYKAFLRSLLTYALPGWFPFLSVTNFTELERLHRAASRAITSCLSSPPIQLLLSETSLPSLRVTLTHFTLLSCERALRLPTSFPISSLARLGVKPKLQIVLESFCVHSSAYAFFYLS